MSIELFVQVMLRNWWIVVLVTVITTATSAAYVFTRQPMYRATTTVELRPSVSLQNPMDILNTINALTRRQVFNTLARKATSSTMQQKVAEELKVPVAAVQAANLAAIAPIDTSLLEISAESSDPQFAASVANAVAQLLLGQTLEKVIQMDIMDVAVPPTVPFEPQPKRVLMLALAFGSLLGVGFALAEHFVRRARASGMLFGSGLDSITSPSLTVPPSLTMPQPNPHIRTPMAVGSSGDGESG